MYARHTLRLIAALLCPLLAGCLGDGGRGSSGFDIRENVIITRVLETQECLSTDSLTFCPADREVETTPTPTATGATPTGMATPTVTPTVAPSPRVDTGLTGGTSITCTRDHVDAPCNLIFSFSAFGFPPEASYYVASRLRAPDADWALASEPTFDSASDPPRFNAAVALTVPSDATSPRVQFAVLVFLSPPQSVPATFEVLAQSGTDFAFVTLELALEVITIGPPPVPTSTATQPIDSTLSPTPSAPTATRTAVTPRAGPDITYFGVARADSVPLAPSDFDLDGRPIYPRPFGHGLSLVIEGRPGMNGRAVGRDAYNPSGGLADLQLIVSRPLGDGSAAVCDRLPPMIGGVPAADPFAFSDEPAVVDAINDLGCRADNGAGEPLARTVVEACTLNAFGEYEFVDSTSTAQYCLGIAVPWAFPSGDTIVAARLRDVQGTLGAVREIVVRNVAFALTPTPDPTSSRTRVPSRTAPATPFTPTPTETPTTPSATPTPTLTPRPGDPPILTHFGVARADDRPLLPIDTDPEGRPIYARVVGQGMSLIIEGRRGARPLGQQAYRPLSVPDLEVIVSRPLGNGSLAVCDIEPPVLGGVPATTPLEFSDDLAVRNAANDIGCRVNDGTGEAQARLISAACTFMDEGVSGYAFVNGDSTQQYCLPIAAAWAFPEGDTIVAARIRDDVGRVSDVHEIVVRVGE